MKPAPFEYHRAKDLEEAVSLLAELGDGAKILAGGQSLVPMMNFRLARPAALIDITRVPGLSYLRSDACLSIGALTRHRQVEMCQDPGVLGGWPVLARAARFIGHYPIRARGTVGGSLAHADPSAEWPILAMALDAEVTVVGPAGHRSIAARDLFQGFLTTALHADEVLIEVRFPRSGRRAALTEFAQRHGDFAVVAVAVSIEVVAGTCREARVVVGGVDATPVRVSAAEQVLVGSNVDEAAWDEAAAVTARAIEPASDLHASAAYRRRLAHALVACALREASEDAA